MLIQIKIIPTGQNASNLKWGLLVALNIHPDIDPSIWTFYVQFQVSIIKVFFL